jgi:hypothetical protein
MAADATQRSAKTFGTLAERNKRLDALAEATKSWADKRTSELQNKVAAAKKILKGRTGSERLATSTTQAASAFLVNEIDDFLLVG